MNIKNYTSTVDVSKSMARIEECLVEIGASNINKKYKDKVCTGITFLYFDKSVQRTLAFHLDADVDAVFKILYEKISKPRPNTKEIIMLQANKTAWKILSDLIEMQCTMILLDQAKPLQMFLPYLYDVDKQESLYTKITTGSLKLNLLT